MPESMLGLRRSLFPSFNAWFGKVAFAESYGRKERERQGEGETKKKEIIKTLLNGRVEKKGRPHRLQWRLKRGKNEEARTILLEVWREVGESVLPGQCSFRRPETQQCYRGGRVGQSRGTGNDGSTGAAILGLSGNAINCVRGTTFADHNFVRDNNQEPPPPPPQINWRYKTGVQWPQRAVGINVPSSLSQGMPRKRDEEWACLTTERKQMLMRLNDGSRTTGMLLKLKRNTKSQSSALSVGNNAQTSRNLLAGDVLLKMTFALCNVKVKYCPTILTPIRFDWPGMRPNSFGRKVSFSYWNKVKTVMVNTWWTESKFFRNMHAHYKNEVEISRYIGTDEQTGKHTHTHRKHLVEGTRNNSVAISFKSLIWN